MTRTRLKILKDYKFVLTVSSAAAFGGWLDFVAMFAVGVEEFSLSSFGVALLSASILVPGIVFSGLVKKIVDSDKWLWALRCALLGRSLANVLIIFAPNVYVFFGLIFVRSLFNAVALPTLTSFVASTVAPVDRNKLYASLSVITSTAKVGAPALGGALMSMVSVTAPFFASSVVTAVAALLLAKKKFQRGGVGIGHVEQETPGQTIRPCKSWQDDAWRCYAFCLLAYAAPVFMVTNQLPLILKRLDFGVENFGFVVAASAVGNITAGIFNSSERLLFQRSFGAKYETLYFPVLGICAIFLFIAVSLEAGAIGSAVGLAFCFSLVGFCTGSFLIASGVFLASNFQHMLGYATSRTQLMQNLIMLLSPFLGALVLNWLGVTSLMATAAAAGLVVIGLFWLLPGRDVSLKER